MQQITPNKLVNCIFFSNLIKVNVQTNQLFDLG